MASSGTDLADMEYNIKVYFHENYSTKMSLVHHYPLECFIATKGAKDPTEPALFPR